MEKTAGKTHRVKDFIDMGEWQKIVYKAGDDRQYLRRDFYEYYKTKYEIALEVRPEDIAEIGVRWGYSAFSFLSAAPAGRYCGFDILAGTHGGAKGDDTFEYVYKMLGERFPAATINLWHCDTRRISTLGGSYDLIHVDGDHSEAGCRHDLPLALAACRPGGTILVDDYDYIKGVQRACEGFVNENTRQFISIEHRRSLRGELILKKSKK